MPEPSAPSHPAAPGVQHPASARATTPKDPLATVLLDAAINYLEQRKGAEAHECATRALAIVRGDEQLGGLVEVLARLASACQMTGRRDAAEKHWQDAVEVQERLSEFLGAAETYSHLASLEKERGDLRRSQTLLLRSLQLSAGAPPGPVRARALEELCPVERRLGEAESALARLSEAIRIREALGDLRQLATNHDHLGNIHLAQSRLPEAIEHYTRALALFDRLELRAGIALVSNNLGIARMHRGEYDLADSCFQRARSLFADLGDERRLAWTVGNLGLLESYRGNARVAEALLRESVAALERIGDRSGQAIFMNNLAPVFRMSGRADEAVAWARRAVALMRELELIEGSTQPWINLAVSELERNHLDEAEAAAREVLSLANRSESSAVKSEAGILQAVIALARRDASSALAHARQAQELAEAGGHPRERAEALRARGEAELMMGDLEAARSSLQSAHAAAKVLDDAFQLALCRLHLGRLYLQVDALEAAARHLRMAADAFDRIGHDARHWETLTLLARAEWPVSPQQARVTLDLASELARSKGLPDRIQRTLELRVELERLGTASPPVQASIVDLPGAMSLARECSNPEEFTLRLLGLVLQKLPCEELFLDRADNAVARIPAPGLSSTSSRDLEVLLQAARSTAQSQQLWLPEERGDHDAARSFAIAIPVRGLLSEPVGVLVARCSVPRPALGTEPPFSSASRTEPPQFVSALRAVSELLGVVWNALAGKGGGDRAAAALGASETATLRSYSGIVGESRAILAVYAAIDRIAPTDSSVLIRGESGTGKELVARAIHDLSARRAGPFVAISCPSIPRDLIEAELFGHERGAYTGANSKRPGQIELAHGGTLFLDEVGDMDLATQTKLLRFLQEREFVPVGGRKPVQVNIRLLAATSRNLEEEVRAGRMREDLYYRINVVPVSLPPLRDRTGDVRPLIRYFLERLAEREAIPPPAITEGALARLDSYSWPGNVRELRNTVEYLITLKRGEPVLEDDLPTTILESPLRIGPQSTPAHDGASLASGLLRPGESLETRVMALEGALIRETLRGCEGNQSKAARMLGIKESTMRHKMKRYGISGEASREERRRQRQTQRANRRGVERDGHAPTA